MRRKLWVLVGLALFSASILRGQVGFEVASVKRGAAIPNRPNFYTLKGGPGTPEPGQLTAIGAPLQALIVRAYALKPYQLVCSRPLDSDRYDVVARIPRGTSVDEFRLMLQNLLAERLGLTVHRGKEEMPVYEMVLARGGLKMKEAQLPKQDAPGDTALPETPAGRRQRAISVDKDGSIQLRPGWPNRVVSAVNGHMRISGRMQGVQDFLQMMENHVNLPVTDKTGLTGKYDFDLDFVPDAAGTANLDVAAGQRLDSASEPAQTFLAAIEFQLGLKLVQRKGLVDVLVVDKWNKVPIEN